MFGCGYGSVSVGLPETLARIRERSPILRGMADKGDIGLAGAMYDVHTGQVTFM